MANDAPKFNDTDPVDFDDTEEIDNAPSFEDTEEADKVSQVVSKIGEKASDAGESLHSGAETIGEGITDFGAGMAQGATLGFAEEAGAGFQTLLDKIGIGYEPEVPQNLQEQGIEAGSPTDIDEQLQEEGFEGDLTPDAASFYRQAQKEEEERHQDIQEKSPWLYGGGQLAGGLATTIGSGGMAQVGKAGKAAYTGARNAGASQLLARLAAGGSRAGVTAGIGAGTGAVLGAGESEGGIIGATPEEQEQLKEDTKTGAVVGGLIGGALQPVQDIGGASLKKGAKWLTGKINEMIDGTGFLGDDYIKAYREVYRQAKKDVKPLPKSSQRLIQQGKGKTLYEESQASSQAVFNKINAADKELSKDVGKAIHSSTEKFEVKDLLTQSRRALEDLEIKFDTDPILDRFYKKAGSYIKKSDNLKVSELNMPQMDRLLTELRSIKKDYVKGQNIHGDAVDVMNDTLRRINEQMESRVGEYATAKSNLKAFRENVIEKFIYPMLPPGVTEDAVKVLRSKGSAVGEETLDFVSGKQTKKLPYKMYSELGRDKETKLYDSVKGIVDLSQADKKLGYPQKVTLDVLSSIVGDVTGEIDPLKQAEIIKQSKVFQKALGMTGEEFADMFEKAGRISHADIMTRKRTALNPWRSTVGGSLKEDIVMGGSGKEFAAKMISGAGALAEKAKSMPQLPLKAGQFGKVAKILQEEPQNLIQRLYKNPATAKYGELLERGLREENQPLINSALYLLNRDSSALDYIVGDDNE